MRTIRSLQGQAVSFASVISGEQFLGDAAVRPVFHVGPDNRVVGARAASHLLATLPAYANSTVCLNQVATLSSHDLRCQGWIATMRGAGLSSGQVVAQNLSGQVADLVHDGVTAIYATGTIAADVIQAVRSLGANTTIVIPTEMQERVAKEMALPNSLVPFLVDTQPYLQGYLSVALMYALRLTRSRLATTMLQTGPRLITSVDANAIGNAARQDAGFPMCTGSALCWDRSHWRIEWVHGAPDNAFWAEARSGIILAAREAGVQVAGDRHARTPAPSLTCRQVREYLPAAPTDSSTAAHVASIPSTNLIGVGIAADASLSATRAIVGNATWQVPVVSVHNDLSMVQSASAYDVNVFMPDYGSGAMAGDLIASGGFAHVTCLYDGAGFNGTRGVSALRDRCLGVVDRLTLLRVTADYAFLSDPLDETLYASAMAPFIASGTDLFVAPGVDMVDYAINVLQGTGRWPRDEIWRSSC